MGKVGIIIVNNLDVEAVGAVGDEGGQAAVGINHKGAGIAWLEGDTHVLRLAYLRKGEGGEAKAATALWLEGTEKALSKDRT